VKIAVLLLIAVCLRAATPFEQAQANGRRFDEIAGRIQRVLHAWLRHADSNTLLLPDRLPGGRQGLKPGNTKRIYTPYNSAADLYPYLILTAHLTDPEIYRGRMLEMLRNEIRYTTAQDSIPGELELTTGDVSAASVFGAAEYAKDGLISVTEMLGRTPWFYRMVDMTADVMKNASVKSRFGMLPASDAEVNGDMLQTLVRLATMTGDKRFLDWARRIGDAYVEEVLPGNNGLPSSKWDFDKHTGEGQVRLRDHGNETVVGLTLLYAIDRSPKYEAAVRRMLDRILESATADGMLYNVIDSSTLKPINSGLSDNWGYVYGSVYTFYQCTGEAKYRDAVRHVLKNLPKYRNYNWENGSFDGYADSIESAIYLVNREPVPEAFDWIETEVEVMARMQQPSGLIEHWYGEGNFNRTLLLYMLSKSQGVRPEHWTPGTRVGAVREGERLYLSVEAPAALPVQFDFARHRRVLNLEKNYVRLNEFPEWYIVDENTLYRLRRGETERVLLGSEMIAGVRLEPGQWTVEPLGKAPYADRLRRR
jgi:hypothetical protein